MIHTPSFGLLRFVVSLGGLVFPGCLTRILALIFLPFFFSLVTLVGLTCFLLCSLWAGASSGMYLASLIFFNHGGGNSIFRDLLTKSPLSLV